jgi:hypothetical protein
VSSAAIVNGFALGAALLALWISARFPGVGARTLRGAAVLVGCAGIFVAFTGAAAGAAKSAAGPAVALLVVALPFFTFAFWAGIGLMRVALSQIRCD